MQKEWNHKVFGVKKDGFEALSLEIFNFQYLHNPVYKAYVDALRVNPAVVGSIMEIPFLPIRFFKSHPVRTTSFDAEMVFESSGTTGSVNSRHFIKNLSLYEESFIKGFELFYGPVKDWCIIALLPSYLERKNSSLVYMTGKLIELCEHAASGFYLRDHEKLFSILKELEKSEQKTLLIGVTFALLDFAETHTLSLRNTVIMETGGMKGRREEMIRPQVHEVLKKAFSIAYVHSEYGMTELLSQAYSKGEGFFSCPPWMRVLIRDQEDPLLISQAGPGAINIIDLANIYSCSFIATDDAGKINKDGSFEVLGRLDGSDLRGCSLMAMK